MNNELDWERVLQWAQSETTYLIHIIIDSQQISIEVEDKYSGDIWHSVFSSTGIEELTAKARNQKKFGVFCKMLMSALLKSTDSLSAQILSYRQLSSRFGKGNIPAKNISPQQASKRFLILTYVGEFEKMQFPLPLMHYSQVTTERLKLTIKRMAQEIHILREGQTEQDASKQNSLLRYENQSLKSKLRNTSKMELSTFLQPRVEELQKEVSDKSNLIVSLEQKISELQKQRRDYESRLRESGQKIQQLQASLKLAESQRAKGSGFSKNLDYYQKKIEQMMDQMKELSGQLAFAREKEKKGQLRMATLQNQLDRIMATKRGINGNNFSRMRDSSSEEKKSERELSVKSGRSGTSQKSQKSQSKNRNQPRKNYNTFAQNQPSNLSATKRSSKKKPSIYQSDTESSRMRRMANSRSSPYRQATNTQPIKKPGNRNKSKSKERIMSPKPLAAESQMLTQGQGYQTDSSGGEELQRVEGYLNQLKKKRAGPGPASKTGVNAVNTNGIQSKVQKRLQNLEQLIRKTAQSTRTRG